LFTALKVVPGGVGGGRLSTIRLVWSTTSIVAIETIATMTAITTGFRRTLSILDNSAVSAEFRANGFLHKSEAPDFSEASCLRPPAEFGDCVLIG
jgi:hypothetical protein